jgi:hypothetical protein
MKKNHFIFKDKYKHLIVFALLLGLCLISQKQYIKEFPKYIHAWSQSDRYALAIGFTKNGMDFFQPQTYYLNTTVFENGELANPEGIAAVDFPVNEYVVAVFMKLFKTTSPAVYRFYILIYSFLGLFFLYLIGYKLFKNELLSFASVVLLMFSPVYFYYQSGFLPSITAISNVFAGVYFYLCFVENRKMKNFLFAVALFTLSALVRTPFLMLFFVLIFVDIIRMYFDNKADVKRISIFFTGFMVFVAYYFYNSWLRHKYGTFFLNELMYTFNIQEIKITLKEIYKNWFFQYFNLYQYIVFALVTIISFVFLLIKKFRFTEIQKSALVFTFAGLFAGFLYLFVMLLQYVNHDYYFLDSFFAVLALGFMVFLSFIAVKKSIYKYLSGVVILIICFFVIEKTSDIEKVRRDPGNWDRTYITYTNYIGSDKLLAELKIPESAKMLVIEGYSYNIPQILMNRKAFSLNAEKETELKAAMNWPYDYIIIQDCYLVSDVVKILPGIINMIEKIGGNGRVSVYKKLAIPNNASLMQFLKLDKQTPLYSGLLDLNKPDSCWGNVKITENSGVICGQILPADEFGIALKLKNFKSLSEKSSILLFSSKIMIKNQGYNEANIVTSVDSIGKNLYYSSFDLKNQVEKENTWQRVNLMFNIPKISSSENSLGVYVWNKGKNEILYDSLRVDIY